MNEALPIQDEVPEIAAAHTAMTEKTEKVMRRIISCPSVGAVAVPLSQAVAACVNRDDADIGRQGVIATIALTP